MDHRESRYAHRLHVRQISSLRSIIHLTMAGSRCEKKLLVPVSSLEIFAVSSASSSKSKIARFSAIRSFRTDFASTTTPRCTTHRSTTWLTVFPYLTAISLRAPFWNRLFTGVPTHTSVEPEKDQR